MKWSSARLFACTQTAYIGAVIVSIDCQLVDAHGNSAAPMAPLVFFVRVSVPVRSIAYSIGSYFASPA